MAGRVLGGRQGVRARRGAAKRGAGRSSSLRAATAAVAAPGQLRRAVHLSVTEGCSAAPAPLGGSVACSRFSQDGARSRGVRSSRQGVRSRGCGSTSAGAATPATGIQVDLLSWVCGLGGVRTAGCKGGNGARAWHPTGLAKAAEAAAPRQPPCHASLRAGCGPWVRSTALRRLPIATSAPAEVHARRSGDSRALRKAPWHPQISGSYLGLWLMLAAPERGAEHYEAAGRPVHLLVYAGNTHVVPMPRNRRAPRTRETCAPRSTTRRMTGRSARWRRGKPARDQDRARRGCSTPCGARARTPPHGLTVPPKPSLLRRRADVADSQACK